MTASGPVRTDKADCRDCYRCIRECVPKAIDVADGHARIRSERCVLCGHCVSVCPVGAKKVRDDLLRAQSLLITRSRVYCSLAPSFAADFDDIPAEDLVAALHHLGFAGVSETALGAQAVAAMESGRKVRAAQGNTCISTACPAVVGLVEKYYPDLVDRLSPAPSPALVHAAMLRETYGSDIGVVFIGPCIAKKREADDHPDLIDIALTFSDLRRWLEQAGHPERRPRQNPSAAAFVPRRAGNAALFPREGGLLANLCASEDGPRTYAASGLSAVRSLLDEVSRTAPARPTFFELLACRGGCIHGPQMSRPGGAFARSSALDAWVRSAPQGAAEEAAAEEAAADWEVLWRRSAGRSRPTAVETACHDEGEIRSALASIGKHRNSDELNCGSCGYARCRDFAGALLDRRAEVAMCAGHMRSIAQKKADALLRAMPSGVVMVNADLRIKECNLQFARLAGEEAELLFDAKPGLEGISIEGLVPFWSRFADVLETGQDSIGRDYPHDHRRLSGSIFVVEPGAMVGGVFQDITEPALRREQIVGRAEEVIRKNLSTVQQIAHLMGENAAETEAMLSSIIDAFGPGRGTEPS